MEISAIVPSSFALSPASEARAAQTATENARKKVGEDAAVARKTSKDAPEQTVQARADALRTSQEAQREQAIQNNIAGSIQFESEEGTRIMKVLDSKEVLIYQVPTKGELTLIMAEETEARQMLVRA